MMFRELWRNREVAYRLLTWFRNIVREASDARDAYKRLAESVARGDLHDVVVKIASVEKMREDFIKGN